MRYGRSISVSVAMQLQSQVIYYGTHMKAFTSEREASLQLFINAYVILPCSNY